MKRIILLLLLINLFPEGHAQLVHGIVLDKSDNSKIGFASIYINGTNIGTLSGQDGQFELDITKHASLPLTISALGYYTVTITDFTGEKPIDVYMAPKMFELNEVIVSAKSTAKERRANLKLFKEQFLGESYNGLNCVIQNEDDITFQASGDTLKAYASKPILIVNNALGYKIAYYLDKFEYCWKGKSFLYKGSSLFSEDMSEKMTKKNFFENRRRNTYLGSRSHFFSSLWTNTLQVNGFSIKNSIDKIINYKDIVIEDTDFKKYLSSKDNLYICYLSNSPNSMIELKNPNNPVFFDSSGYFDGSNVRVIGQMAKQRIGDLLPYDYRLK